MDQLIYDYLHRCRYGVIQQLALERAEVSYCFNHDNISVCLFHKSSVSRCINDKIEAHNKLLSITLHLNDRYDNALYKYLNFVMVQLNESINKNKNLSALPLRAIFFYLCIRHLSHHFSDLIDQCTKQTRL